VGAGSTDGTGQSLAARTALSLRHLCTRTTVRPGPATRGAAAAEDGILIFLNNDISVWTLSRSAPRRSSRTPDAGSSGRSRILRRSGTRHLAATVTTSRNASGTPRHHLAGRRPDYRADLSWPRQDFLRFGGFDLEFTIASLRGHAARTAHLRQRHPLPVRPAHLRDTPSLGDRPPAHLREHDVEPAVSPGTVGDAH
jgi:hypothetical protein